MADVEEENPMLEGWDLQEARVATVLARAFVEFRDSDRAASLPDWQADALVRAGLVAPPTPTAVVGRCGVALTTGFGANWCKLPVGHAGWHLSDQGTEWQMLPASAGEES